FKGNVTTLDIHEYVRLAADFLERIPPDVTIQRLVGDTHGNFLISPVWKAGKSSITTMITQELEKRGAYQGSLCDASTIINSSQKPNLNESRLHIIGF
ncbi:MAG: hypothetical protein H3C64_12495, partial [Candidatus Kuenenia stuttgartiensis]|nr:hypothetical protein [Candidatus Kuenenia stuttgartiensis]